MSLRGKQKIWYLINRIIDELEITPINEPISLHPAQDLNNNYVISDLISLFNKLETEHNAVQLLNLPSDQTLNKYQIKILPGFTKYLSTLENDPGYMEWSGKTTQSKDMQENNATIAAKITYTKARQIIINDLFELSKTTLNGENDLVFSYIYKNPNKLYTKKYLESEIGQRITKPFHKIVENLGFKGDLAKIFFSVAKDSIEFRNPIHRDDLSEMGFNIIKMNRIKNT